MRCPWRVQLLAHQFVSARVEICVLIGLEAKGGGGRKKRNRVALVAGPGAGLGRRRRRCRVRRRWHVRRSSKPLVGDDRQGLEAEAVLRGERHRDGAASGSGSPDLSHIDDARSGRLWRSSSSARCSSAGWGRDPSSSAGHHLRLPQALSGPRRQASGAQRGARRPGLRPRRRLDRRRRPVVGGALGRPGGAARRGGDDDAEPPAAAGAVRRRRSVRQLSLRRRSLRSSYMG